MIIDHPSVQQLPALQRLWQQAFGDSETFTGLFFRTGFSPERCFCLCTEGSLAAALYWFDCEASGQKLAYLYAVATDAAFQRRGLCHTLMAHTHAQLAALGYAGTVLVPADKGLTQFYGAMGYKSFGGIREFTCTPGDAPVPLRAVDETEYARLRRSLLPEGSVLQEGPTLAFLAGYTELYAGEGFVLAAARENETLLAAELLGDTSQAPGILSAMGMKKGRFRTPGTQTPFAMCRPLSPAFTQPSYFGLALD